MSNGITRISQLKLSAEQRDIVNEHVAALTAVNVYRELQAAKTAAEEAQSGCNIIGNCCSSSKAEL